MCHMGFIEKRKQIQLHALLSAYDLVMTLISNQSLTDFERNDVNG